jgi:hypothetical protein
VRRGAGGETTEEEERRARGGGGRQWRGAERGGVGFVMGTGGIRWG